MVVETKPPEPVPAWSLPRRVLFRFGFVYWLLFCVPILIGMPGLDKVAAWVEQRWNDLGIWVGRHIVGVTGPIDTGVSGSGDRIVNYLQVFSFALVAALVTIVWSILARRRREHERLGAALVVIIRYTLAITMMSYGLIKVFASQFPAPGAHQLAERYGEASPMGLLWTFMGASPAYQIFGGACEALGALLLFSRRTVTLGALLLAFVLTNVLLLNLCYDVPVKLYSAHYLAMSIFLVLPEARRLLDVLVLNRPVPARPVPRPPLQRWRRLGLPIAKWALVATLLGFMIHDTADQANQYQAGPIHWYDGYWDVQTFQKNGVDVADMTRWKRLRIDSFGGATYGRWHVVDGTYSELYVVTVDDSTQTMTWTEKGTGTRVDFHMLRMDKGDILLTGNVGADEIKVRCSHQDMNQSLLITRGFHWISDMPFNR